MNDITFEQYLGGDPMTILKKAQDKLREEEMARQTLESLLSRTKELPQEVDSRLVAPRENEARTKLMERLAQDTPLDRIAQIGPEEIERQMRERIWGAPAKSKIGKVGKGVADFFGAFSGLPTDFSKPAMEQFLKIQEQYRKDRANDLSTYNQTANAIGREQGAQDKSMVDWNKAVMKTTTDMFRTKDYATFHDNMNKNWQAIRASDSEKNRMKAQEIVLKAEEIRNRFANNPQAMAQALQRMPEAQRYETLWLYDMVTGLQGANRGSGSGSTSTTTTVRDTLSTNEFGNTVPGPQLSTTSTRQSGRGGGNAVNQQRANEIRAQLAQKLGMPNPMGPTTLHQPQVSAAKPTKPKAVESVVDLPSVSGDDTFRLSNPSFSNTFKNATAGEQFKGLKEQTKSAYEMSSRLLRGIEGNYIKDVMGGKNQPFEAAGRFLEDIKVPGGREFGTNIQNTWNKVTGKYENDWDKQKLYDDITRERVNLISQKVLEMSGRAASDRERAFLSTPYIHLSDSPIAATHALLRLTLRLGTQTRMRELGIADNIQPDTLAKINEYIDEQADGLLNRSRQRATNKLASANTGKFDVSEMNPDKVLYGALKKGNMLDQFPQLRLEQAPAKKATQELRKKLRGLSLEQREKALGLDGLK